MYRVLIENLGGMFNHISLQVGKVCKMVSKIICECVTLILKHSTGDDLIDYKIYGNSVQDGTPTPSEPIEVVSLGEGGKNLFDKEDVVNGKSLSNIGELDNHSDYSTSNFKIIQNNVQLTMSGIHWGRIAFYDSTKTFISYVANNNTSSITVEKPNNAVYYRLSTTTETLNSTQLEEGTEATDYVPYRSVNVITSGKNLFNKATIEDNLRIRIAGTTSPNDNYAVSDFIKVNEGQQYHCNAFLSIGSTTYGLAYFNNLKEPLNQGISYDSYVETTITIPSGVSYIRFTIPKVEVSIDDVQFEQGTTATPYEPYIAPTTTTIDLTGHEPLRKIGYVSDYIDYDNGKIVRNIGKYIFDGTEDWTTNGANSNYRHFGTLDINGKLRLGDTTNLLCSHFAAKTYSSTVVGQIGISYRTYYATTFGFQICDTHGTTSDFNNWLAEQYTNGTPVTVYYQLETPVEENITLPSIPTVEGTTIISFDNTPEPSNAWAKYYASEE